MQYNTVEINPNFVISLAYNELEVSVIIILSNMIIVLAL